MKTIGFIGLGTMGKPMAMNLLKQGFAVNVYNRTAEKTHELVSAGAEAMDSPDEAARLSDVLITMLSDDESVLNVFYGSEGVLQGIRPGMTVIDCTTVSPGTSRQLHAQLEEHLVDFLDAPVTGSQPAAVAGTLVFMVGGRREMFESHQDIFEAMGDKAVYLGPAGSGSCAKLAHNSMVGIHVAALAEALTLAASSGIDPEKFLDIVQAGGAGSRQAELKGPKILDRDFSAQFSLKLMVKDLLLASKMSNRFQLPVPLLQTAVGLFQMGLAKELGSMDSSAIIQCYEEWAHRKVARTKPGRKSQILAAAQSNESERRKSTRIPMDIKLQLSVYEWEREGSFSGQNIAGTLQDLSESGLLIVSSFPLAPEMFIVIHFPQEAQLPPITVKILRIKKMGGQFHYGCMMSGLPPYTRLKLEDYIKQYMAKLQNSDIT